LLRPLCFRCQAALVAAVITLHLHVVQAIREAVDEHRKLVARSVNVFADEYSAGRKRWQNFLQGNDLLFEVMAPIVNYDIDLRYLFNYTLPKRTILLVTNKDVGLVIFVSFARRFYVNAV
jgi:hypothetical protein